MLTHYAPQSHSWHKVNIISYFCLSILSAIFPISAWSGSGRGFLVGLFPDLALAVLLSLSMEERRLAIWTCLFFCRSRLEYRVALWEERPRPPSLGILLPSNNTATNDVFNFTQWHSYIRLYNVLCPSLPWSEATPTCPSSSSELSI